MTKTQIYYTSRTVTVALVVIGIGSLFVIPTSAFHWTLDVLVRSYVMFLGTVMAHEAAHGQLGKSKGANLWWGRLALVMAMVPAVSFRKTHWLHHKNTNIPDEDPDHWVNPRNIFEVPFRSVALPHYWWLWLWRKGKLVKRDWVELALWYAGLAVIYGTVALVAGPERLITGMAPALFIVSVFLWYPFAVKTHEGFAIGSPEVQSHNYYGAHVYWLTLGLSMHRAHHMHPTKSWIELRDFVESAPLPWWRRMLFPRDIRT